MRWSHFSPHSSKSLSIIIIKMVFMIFGAGTTTATTSPCNNNVYGTTIKHPLWQIYWNGWCESTFKCYEAFLFCFHCLGFTAWLKPSLFLLKHHHTAPILTTRDWWVSTFCRACCFSFRIKIHTPLAYFKTPCAAHTKKLKGLRKSQPIVFQLIIVDMHKRFKNTHGKK